MNGRLRSMSRWILAFILTISLLASEYRVFGSEPESWRMTSVLLLDEPETKTA